MEIAQVITPVLRPATNLAEDWMVLVWLAALLALAYTRKYYPLRLSRLWSSVWNVRIMRQVIREEPNTPRANLLFNLSFYLLISLLIYAILKQFFALPFGLSGLPAYLVLLAAVGAAYFIKLIGIRLVKLLAGGDFGLAEYEYNVFLINRLNGLFLLPMLVVVLYNSLSVATMLLYITLSIIGLMILYRMLRGIINASLSGVPIFYIFFYICTLEILPIVVCVKALGH